MGCTLNSYFTGFTFPIKLPETFDPSVLIREHVRFQNGDQGFFDISIRLRDGKGEHLIVVESKIGATAEDGQLEKYENNLDQPPEGRS